ncbi:MAG TPA: multicopper oxidase family protein [Solirubrobacteraceae bacterium]|nr:multicopper oxidase family protein [Solirubrobacteraceae bacterium]
MGPREQTPHRAPGWTRRGFLGVAAGAALTAGGLPGPSRFRGARADGDTLREPPRLHSRDGLLRVTLRAEEREAFVAGQLRKAIVYNGSFPGPTLVVDPGDRLEIELVNRLEEPTNLHTHGFHVSPEGNSDNVLLHIDAGATFDFRFDIPANHAPGLNWYHPHAHGHGTPQMFGGMAGAVIFRSEAERRGPAPSMRDRVLVLQAPEWDAAGELKTWSAGLLATQMRLVNGQLNPDIPIRRGETQRWRILNASVSDFFDLRLDGHRLVQIAADGNPFERLVATETVHIPPGGRAEVLVEGGPPGSYALRAMPSDHGAGFVSPELVLATLRSSPGGGSASVKAHHLTAPFCDFRELAVDRRRTVTMTMRGGFRIDGKPFDPDRVDQVVELGALEEWTVVNDSPLIHPFHIHVNPFQLTHVDGVPVDEPSYRDTVSIRPGGGSVTFRTLFADFPGRSVYHCHIVPHSDLGMMGVFEVVGADDAAAQPAAPDGFVCRF